MVEFEPFRDSRARLEKRVEVKKCRPRGTRKRRYEKRCPIPEKEEEKVKEGRRDEQKMRCLA